MTENLSREFNKALHDEMQAALDKWDREAMAALIKKDADISLTDRLGNTPFMIAAIKGDVAFAQLLLGKGADYSVTNKSKLNALSVSVCNGRMDILRLMAGAGVDLGMKDGFGLTAMDWAEDKEYGSAEKVKTLQDIMKTRSRRVTEEEEKACRNAFDLRQERLKGTARRRRPKILATPVPEKLF